MKQSFYLYICLVFFLNSILLTLQQEKKPYIEFEVTTLFHNEEGINPLCVNFGENPYAISLLNPIFTLGATARMDNIASDGIEGKAVYLRNPFGFLTELEKGTKQSASLTLKNQEGKDITLSVKALKMSRFITKGNYVWGLSYSQNQVNCEGCTNEETFWNSLNNTNSGYKKIFSINKFSRPEDDLICPKNYSSTLYLGGVHEDFTKKENAKYIGVFDLIDDMDNIDEQTPTEKSKLLNQTILPFWGVRFSGMYLNKNKTKIPLTNSQNKLYKVYFISEDEKMIFPKKFMEEFILNINKKNYSTTEDDSFVNIGFNDYETFANTTIDLKFVDEKGNIEIRTSIGDKSYFYADCQEKQKEFDPNVAFADIDFILLPIYLFKDFHILFDGEEKKMKLYTNNTDILQVKVEETPKEDTKVEEGSGGAVIAFVIILTIVILGLIAGFFYLKKNRKIGKFGGKFNILDEDEDFHKMNENSLG